MSLDDVVARAFNEAMPRGDLASRHLRLDDVARVTKLTAEVDLTLAAREVFDIAVKMFTPRAEIHWQFENGARVLAGQVAAWVKAPPRGVLTAEPIALDLLGQACGVATLTAAYVAAVANTRARVTPGRRFGPGPRDLELAGLAAGGGVPLAEDRSDVLVISRNFARAAGSVHLALTNVRAGFGGPVVAECESNEDVEAAVAARVQRVILGDAVDPADVRARVPSSVTLEARASSPEHARRLALAGVDLVRAEALWPAPPARFAVRPPDPA